MPYKITPERLARVRDSGFAKLQQARTNRQRFIRDYVGRYWLEDDGVTRPVNLINQAVRTIVSPLATQVPTADVNTPYPELRPYAELTRLAMDDAAERNRDDWLVRMCLFDALTFPFAVCKSGIKAGADLVRMGNQSIDPGEVYCSRVSPDDIIVDPAARDINECQTLGHRYRVQRDFAADSGLYDADRIMRLPTVPDSRYAGGQGADTRAADMGWAGGYGVDRATLVPMVELVDFWLRDENRIVTMPGTYGIDAEELSSNEEWYGPPRPTGPYDFLMFEPVPDLFAGAVPVGIWYDLAMYANTLARKMFAQIGRSKNLLLYQTGNESDALAAKNAADGAVLGVDNVNAFMQATLGGVDPQVAEFVRWLKQTWSEQSGNLDQLAGANTSGRTDTLGEVEILQGNMMSRVRDMQSMLEGFITSIFKLRAFYLHHDPFISRPLSRRLPSGVEIPLTYSAQTRSGEFWQFAIKVMAGSTRRKTPDLQAQDLIELATVALPAFMQATMSTMGRFNLDAAVRGWAQKKGITEIGELWLDPMMQAVRQQAMMGMMQAGVQPSQAQPQPGAPAPRPSYRSAFQPSTGAVTQRSANPMLTGGASGPGSGMGGGGGSGGRQNVRVRRPAGAAQPMGA